MRKDSEFRRFFNKLSGIFLKATAANGTKSFWSHGVNSLTSSPLVGPQNSTVPLKTSASLSSHGCNIPGDGFALCNSTDEQQAQEEAANILNAKPCCIVSGLTGPLRTRLPTVPGLTLQNVSGVDQHLLRANCAHTSANLRILLPFVTLQGAFSKQYHSD